MHVHMSLKRDDGSNAFDDPTAPDGLTDIARQFGAGILAHTPALTAFLCPTVNAYRRMEVESLAPTHVNWGLDNRLAMLRYPAQRGAASRVEMRVGDGSAAIHNAVASLLFAGLDGLERGLELPPECARLPYEDDETLGEPLPSSLGDALDALARRRVPVRPHGRPAGRDLRPDQALRARPLARPPRQDHGLGAHRVRPPPVAAGRRP